MTRDQAIVRSRIIIVIWALATLALGLGATVYPWLLVLTIAMTLLAGFWLMSMKCENCGYPMHRRKVSIMGAEFAYWTPLVSARCIECRCGTEPGADSTRSARLQRARILLAFLIVVNLVGGIGLAQRIDERFVWVAIVIPSLCLVLLLLSLIVPLRNTKLSH